PPCHLPARSDQRPKSRAGLVEHLLEIARVDALVDVVIHAEALPGEVGARNAAGVMRSRVRDLPILFAVQRRVLATAGATSPPRTMVIPCRLGCTSSRAPAAGKTRSAAVSWRTSSSVSAPLATAHYCSPGPVTLSRPA